MTRPTLTSILLCSVSMEALDYGLDEGAFSVPTYPAALNREIALGFLSRVRTWLYLIFGGLFGREVVVHPAPRPCEKTLNRRGERRAKHQLPLAYSTYALGHILLRRYGLGRFLQWLCNFTLLSRAERCFLSRRRFWAARRWFSACRDRAKIGTICEAPLRPD